MDITFLGHASFRIKSRNSVIVTDPFDPAMVGLKYPKIPADIVTVSHSHSDHNNVSAISEVKRLIDGPGEYEVGGVSVIGYRTFHDDKNGAERGKNTIFVYEMDELRLCHLGDLGHELSNDLVEEIGNIDVLMIPVGGFYTMSVEIAAKVSQLIEASIVIPMHFGEPGISNDLKQHLADVDEFVKLSGLSVEKMDKLTVKNGDIPEEGQKIVILERKN